MPAAGPIRTPRAVIPGRGVVLVILTQAPRGDLRSAGGCNGSSLAVVAPRRPDQIPPARTAATVRASAPPAIRTCGACGANRSAIGATCAKSVVGSSVTYGCKGAVTCGATRCAAGDDCCGSTCTNVAADPFNCGACGNKCPLNEFCAGGSCGPAGPRAQRDLLRHGCSNLQSDSSNCGSAAIPARPRPIAWAGHASRGAPDSGSAEARSSSSSSGSGSSSSLRLRLHLGRKLQRRAVRCARGLLRSQPVLRRRRNDVRRAVGADGLPLQRRDLHRLLLRSGRPRILDGRALLSGLRLRGRLGLPRHARWLLRQRPDSAPASSPAWARRTQGSADRTRSTRGSASRSARACRRPVRRGGQHELLRWPHLFLRTLCRQRGDRRDDRAELHEQHRLREPRVRHDRGVLRGRWQQLQPGYGLRCGGGAPLQERPVRRRQVLLGSPGISCANGNTAGLQLLQRVLRQRGSVHQVVRVRGRTAAPAPGHARPDSNGRPAA